MATARPQAAESGRLDRARLLRWLLAGLLVAVLLLLVVFPIGMLLYASLVDSPPRPGAPPQRFTLANYAAVLNGANLAALRNSFLIGLGGTAVSVVIGASLAWFSARTDVPGRAVVQVAGIMPLFIPALVGALAWSFVASPTSGYLNLAFASLGSEFNVNVYSLPGMIFVFGLYYAPYSFLFLNSALALMNPEFEEAATVHGGELRSVLGGVTFPLVKPALLGASILTFALVLENFTVPQVLGGPVGIPTLPSRIYSLMTSSPARPNEATVVGVLLMVLMAVLILGQNRLLRGRSYTTVTGKGFRPRVVALGRWRWAAFAAALAFLFLAVGVPFLALMQTAMRQNLYLSGFSDLFDTSQLSFDSFGEVLSDPRVRLGLRNSIILGTMTALLGGAFHLLLAYLSHRTRLPGRRLLEYLAVAPIAIPSLVLSLGFLWAWINLPVPVYGTMAVLVMAYTVRFMPQGYRSLTSTIGQVHADLEDSAFVSGASRARAVWSVTVPLIRTGVISTMLLLFILAVRELTASLFLATFDTRVLAIVLFDTWVNGRLDQVAAISILYSLLLLVVTLVARRWFRVDQI